MIGLKDFDVRAAGPALAVILTLSDGEVRGFSLDPEEAAAFASAIQIVNHGVRYTRDQQEKEKTK